MSISYRDKQNKRPLGQELHIFNESHTVGIVGVVTIEANTIKLVEVPRKDNLSSVSIPGYTEVTTAPSVGQFQVNYTTGYILFDSSAEGNTVLVTYWGRGSEVDAVDVNELQGPVGVALTFSGAVTPQQLSSDPSIPQLGQIYFNTTTNQWTGWNGTIWVILG